MEKLQFKLEVFEGPLELLLHLISKNKMNIHDIEISSLLEQYLDYIYDMREADLEIAGEFLEMAARLVYIKSNSLLPKHEEEANEMKKELTGQLIELSLVKEAARRLGIMKEGYLIFVKLPDKIDIDYTYRNTHDVVELKSAYLNLFGKAKSKLPPPTTAFEEIVEKKIVSVASKIVYILRKLYKYEKVEYNSLFWGLGRSDLIAVFLAVLELIKTGRITLGDDGYLYLERRPNYNTDDE